MIQDTSTMGVLARNFPHHYSVYDAERKAHRHQKPMMTWQKRRFALKWQVQKTPWLLVSGAAPG